MNITHGSLLANNIKIYSDFDLCSGSKVWNDFTLYEFSLALKYDLTQ